MPTYGKPHPIRNKPPRKRYTRLLKQIPQVHKTYNQAWNTSCRLRKRNWICTRGFSKPSKYPVVPKAPQIDAKPHNQND